MQSFIIQSHRGAGNLAPENTLESFELAWKIGTVPEADVRSTLDGIPVAFHDEDFRRLSPNTPQKYLDRKVNDLLWDQICDLDVGSYKGDEFTGQRIPKVSDIFKKLRTFPDRMLYLDVKEVPLELLADMAQKYGVSRQVILASTCYSEITQWMTLCPDSKTLHWMGGTEEQLRDRIASLKKSNFAGIKQLQIHIGSANPLNPSSTFLKGVGEEVKARGILFQALFFCYASMEDYHHLMDLGVESFATDHPLITLSAMKSYCLG